MAYVSARPAMVKAGDKGPYSLLINNGIWKLHAEG
jgi:hypothetical protein